jgi:uncharacterized protein (DUF1800 family)
MEQPGPTCPQCSQAISLADTIVSAGGRLSHWNCRRPRALSADERALLSSYCLNHLVARCQACARQFHLSHLAADLDGGLRCSQCRRDLTDSVRAHLYGCAMLPAGVRRRAKAAREAARDLVKRSQQLHDNADVLLREAEVALDERRKALRRSLSNG